MVAYTSVSHMGFILIGAYAGTEMALQGVVIQILSHGISTGALFILAGIIQERTHTRDFDKLGGLWATAPKLGGFLLLFALASLGLPAMGNFVGEFMILLGTYQVNPIITIIASTGFVFSAVYALKLVQMSIFGKNENSWDVKDLNTREIVTLGLLSIVILWLGLFPQPIFNTAKQSLIAIQQSVTSSGDQESGITR
jgi:NADH-quinone oxidoreductase subunit M